MESAKDSNNSSHPGMVMCSFHQELESFSPPLNLAEHVPCFDQKNVVEVMLCQLRVY